MKTFTIVLLLLTAAPICAQHTSSGWSIDSRTGCKIWNDKPNPGESVYWSGTCTNGIANGDGVATWLVNGTPFAVYIGEFVQGRAEGSGTLTYANGTKYVGNFSAGVPNGRGTSTSPDGRKYVGEVRNGKRHGQGTLTRADGSVSYSGTWLADAPVSGQ